ARDRPAPGPPLTDQHLRLLQPISISGCSSRPAPRPALTDTSTAAPSALQRARAASLARAPGRHPSTTLRHTIVPACTDAASFDHAPTHHRSGVLRNAILPACPRTASGRL